MKILAGLVVSCGLMFGQGSLQVTGVTSVSLRVVGNNGSNTFAYWVVANVAGGQATVSPQAIITNAPTPSASNSIVVSWVPIVGAISYDVLRTIPNTQPNPPSPCVCSVVTGTTATTFNDIGGALGSYTYAPIGSIPISGGGGGIPINLGTTVLPASLPVSVLAFGAKCDGVTDDTGALNAAIAAASGKTLITQSGTCIHQPITIGVPITIRIEGGASWKLKAGSVSNQLTLTVGGISIYGPGTLDGNSANNGAALSGVVVSVGLSNVIVQGITFLNNTQSSVMTSGAGITKVYVRGNTFNGSGINAVYFNGDTQFSEILDNIFLGGTSDAIQLNASKNNRIARNRISGYTRMCIEVFGGSDKAQVLDNNCLVTSNVVNAFGISVDTSPNTIVSGNYVEFTNPATGSFGIEDAASDFCEISSNTIVGAYTPIALDRGSHSVVSNNVVNGTTGPASIFVSSSSAANVVRNIISNNRVSFVGNHIGIWLQCNNAGADCSGNGISGNSVSGDGTAGSHCIDLERDTGILSFTTLTANNCRSAAIGINFASDTGTVLYAGTNDNVGAAYGGASVSRFIVDTANAVITTAGISLSSSNQISNVAKITSITYFTAADCLSIASPAVCGSAAAGSVVVAAAATSVVVNTTTVTANSQIFLMYDASLGTRLGVTCNVTEPAIYGVTARVAATSFTITVGVAPITNPACFSYLVIN